MRMIYFGGKFYPSLEERANLEELQKFFRETDISMLVECKFNKYEYTVRRQMLANKLRDKWIIIPGGRTPTPA